MSWQDTVSHIHSASSLGLFTKQILPWCPSVHGHFWHTCLMIGSFRFPNHVSAICRLNFIKPPCSPTDTVLWFTKQCAYISRGFPLYITFNSWQAITWSDIYISLSKCQIYVCWKFTDIERTPTPACAAAQGTVMEDGTLNELMDIKSRC